MLSLRHLRSLDHGLDGQHVLTVVLDGESHDPAAHGRWRQELTKGIRSWRHRLDGASREVRADFERAVELLVEAAEGQAGAADGKPGALAAPAWLGVATPDAVHVAMPLPVRASAFGHRRGRLTAHGSAGGCGLSRWHPRRDGA